MILQTRFSYTEGNAMDGFVELFVNCFEAATSVQGKVVTSSLWYTPGHIKRRVTRAVKQFFYNTAKRFSGAMYVTELSFNVNIFCLGDKKKLLIVLLPKRTKIFWNI